MHQLFTIFVSENIIIVQTYKHSMLIDCAVKIIVWMRSRSSYNNCVLQESSLAWRYIAAAQWQVAPVSNKSDQTLYCIIELFVESDTGWQQTIVEDKSVTEHCANAHHKRLEWLLQLDELSPYWFLFSLQTTVFHVSLLMWARLVIVYVNFRR